MEKSNMEKSKMGRGEIVWARVVYPHQWWPGIVLRRDFLGVLVSFLDVDNSPSSRPRYFIESEVVAFVPNFKSLVHRCTNDALLDRALRMFGRNVSSGLERCRFSLFAPWAVLGFVRGLAVSPWVEVSDYLSAADAFAQFAAFRRHMFSSASGQAQEKLHSDAEELEQEVSEIAGENFSACSTNAKNKSSLVLEESLSPQDNNQIEISSISQTERKKMQPLQEMMVNLHILALDPVYLDGSCLNTLKSNFLSFRKLSCENTVGDSCSPIEKDKPQLLSPGCIMLQQGTKVHEAVGKTTLSLVPYVESPSKCLGEKRKLNLSTVSEPPIKLQKVFPLSTNRADAYLWRSNYELASVLSDATVMGNAISSFSQLFNTMAVTLPFSSVEACIHLLRTGCESDLIESSFSAFQLDLKTQTLSGIVAQSSACIHSSSSRDFILKFLNFFCGNHKSCYTNQNKFQISRIQNPAESVDKVDGCGTHTSNTNVQQPEDCGPNMEIHGTLKSYAADVTVKLMQPVSKNAAKTRSDDSKASSIIRGTRKLKSYLSADKLKLLHRDLVKSYRERNKKVAAGYSMKKNKEMLQPVTSALAIKSEAGQPSAVRNTLSISRSLLIKFPKDSSLPSKEELVKRFSRFGMIDCFNTNVYFYTGSARVVFLHELDAMAAYQHTKRKKIAFFKANVKIWLDPSKFSTAKLPGFSLRSCLKKSSVLQKESKKCPTQVRFLV